MYCIIYYPTSIIIGNNSESFLTASRLENSPEEAVNEQRVGCDVDCIIQLLGKICRQPNCQASISYKKNNIGCTLNIQWKCLQGHSGKWSSSKRCYSRNGYPFFVNNVLMASSILLSGNNFSKIALFCTSFNLQHIKTTTFYQVQRHYLCPTTLHSLHIIHTHVSNLHSNGCLYSLFILFASLVTASAKPPL